MSIAVTFLLVGLAAAVVGSAGIWAMGRRPRQREADFHEQLRAIAPRRPIDERGPAAQPTGVVPLEPHDEER